MFRCTPIPSYSTLACFTKGDPVAGRGRGEPPCVAQLSRIWVPWCPKAAETRFKRISKDLDLKLAMDGGILSTLKNLRATLQTIGCPDAPTTNEFNLSCCGFNRAVHFSLQVQTPQRKELIEAEPRIAMVDTKGDRQS